MERIEVKSSNLRNVGYDKKTETLEIEFTSRAVYQYSGVPEEVYIELMEARSKGSYFAKAIKDNRYYGCAQVLPVYRQLR